MIDIHCTITEAEYLDAQQLFLREQNRKSRWWRRTMSAICIASAAVVLLNLPRPLKFANLPPYTFSLIVIGTLPLWIPALQRRAFRKRFAKEKANLTNAHIVLNENGYSCEVPGIGSGIAEWTGMSSWLEGEKVFMIRSGYIMRIVPKNALDSDQMEAVRQLLAERIIRAKSH